MKNYDQQTRIYTKLCRIYEKNNTSFYRVLDYLVGSFNKDQLKEIEQTLIHQFGENL
mgnify:FL=1|tara:strand:- start:509 stop:679 length:171 start_codon:yes stop_codon:yes gene_type:complete